MTSVFTPEFHTMLYVCSLYIYLFFCQYFPSILNRILTRPLLAANLSSADTFANTLNQIRIRP